MIKWIGSPIILTLTEIPRIYSRIKKEIVYRGPSSAAGGVAAGLTATLMDKLPLYEALPAAGAGGLLAGIVCLYCNSIFTKSTYDSLIKTIKKVK